MNRNTGEYLGYTYLSPYFIESDHRMAHELGPNVTNASDPIYWSNHHISDLNYQENQENPQAKTAIEWQKNWDVKYNNLKK